MAGGVQPNSQTTQGQGNSGLFGAAGGSSNPAAVGNIGMGAGRTVDVQQGLPIATGFGGGSMTPQAAPQQPSTIGIGPSANTIRPTFQPSVSPIVQQMANRIAMQNNPYNTGLQSLFNRFNIPQQPMMRAPMQMPAYQNPALNYRPNMQAIQQNLSRVKPSVFKSDLDAARARIAELEGQQGSYDSGYVGGG